MSRLPLLLAATVLVAGCGAVSDVGADARARADEARSRVDDARSRVDAARGQLDELRDRAGEIGRRATWCGAAARLGTALAERDVAAVRDAAQDLRAGAPAELADEVRTIGEASVRAQTGDPTSLLDPEVRDAALVVLDEARRSCGG